MQYTKKPVTIEAVKWDGKEFSEFPSWLSMEVDNINVWIHGTDIQIKTLEGVMTASAGDYIIRGIKGELYPCKPDIFEATYSVGTSEPTKLLQLEDFQNKIGYVKGDINIVALLGLFGEAGEVLNETFLIDNTTDEIKAEDLKILACQQALKIDELKKQIRDKKRSTPLIRLCTDNDNTTVLLDKELADCFYYINALAINRGLTLNDLAAMCLEKVALKQSQKN